MAKYNQYSNREQQPRQRQIHPIWRGVGFALIILTPIMAYSAGLILIDANRTQGWIRIPPGLILGQFSDPLILVKIFLTLIISILIYGVFSFITFFLYTSMGPPRYGPYDVPPVEYRGKRYKR
jgi:hypothetical protein